MTRLTILLGITLLPLGLFALRPTCTIPLYPYGAPDSNGYTAADEYVEQGTMIFRTSEPRIDLYRAPQPKGIILVCPGGAYIFTSTGNEGVNVAEFFVPRGYTIAVLKYRMPNGHENIPLEDACRAMSILRDSLDTWQLPASQIGVMGFSAGGHLAASLLTKYTDSRTRPDYGILIYPVISMDSNLTHSESCRQLLGDNPSDSRRILWSADRQVTTDTPPCLIVGCQDDETVKIENSIRFYQALTAANVPATLVIVPEGGHGWGFLRHFPHRELIEQAILSFLK